MTQWLPLFVFGGVLIATLFLVMWMQGQRYPRYLSGHAAQTEKITAGQREIIAQAERQIAACERAVVAMERIATVLEQRSEPGGNGIARPAP